MTLDEIIAHLEGIRADHALSSEAGGSGFVDPSSEELAMEQRARDIHADVARELSVFIITLRASE